MGHAGHAVTTRHSPPGLPIVISSAAEPSREIYAARKVESTLWRGLAKESVGSHLLRFFNVFPIA